MDKLAVIVLACNEDNVLGRCLQSCAGMETHVSIDEKTTDDSRAVAEQFGAKLYSHTFLDNSWSATRNAVMEQVEAASDAEWFAWLDADEWWLAGKEIIPHALAEAEANGCDGISITLHDFPNRSNVTPGEWLNVKILRRGIRYHRRRHEVVPADVDRVSAPGVIIGHQKGQRPEVIDANDKLKRDGVALMADFEEFRDRRSAYYVADYFESAGDFNTACAWCREAISLPNEQAGVEALIRDKWAQCLRRQGRHAEAIEISRGKLLLGREEFGEACFDIGADSHNADRPEDAEFYLKLALSASATQKLSGIANPEKTGTLAYYALSLVELNRGNHMAAAAYLGRAIETGGQREKYAELWQMILQAGLQQLQPAEESAECSGATATTSENSVQTLTDGQTASSTTQKPATSRRPRARRRAT